MAVDDTRFSASFDDAGHVKDITGNFLPNLHGFPTKPALSPEQAAAAAEADMVKTLPTGATLDPKYTPKPHGGAVHAPYYMQQDLDDKPELYVVIPAQATRVFSSSKLDVWDTQAVLNTLPDQNAGSRVDPGSAVDAYFYVGEADQWWRKIGRNGWDNRDSVLSIRVHDPIDYTTSPPS